MSLFSRRPRPEPHVYEPDDAPTDASRQEFAASVARQALRHVDTLADAAGIPRPTLLEAELRLMRGMPEGELEVPPRRREH